MFDVVLRHFPGRDGMIDSPRLEAVGEIGVAVVQRMSPQQKQTAFEPILDKLRGTPHAYARKSVAAIIVALADGLLPAQRRVAREAMQSMLAWSERVPESVAAAGALVALSAVNDPANRTADPLRDAARYPRFRRRPSQSSLHAFAASPLVLRRRVPSVPLRRAAASLAPQRHQPAGVDGSVSDQQSLQYS